MSDPDPAPTSPPGQPDPLDPQPMPAGPPEESPPPTGLLRGAQQMLITEPAPEPAPAPTGPPPLPEE